MVSAARSRVPSVPAMRGACSPSLSAAALCVLLGPQGYGGLLMAEAERIAAQEHRSTKIAVISGVGVRHYYRWGGACFTRRSHYVSVKYILLLHTGMLSFIQVTKHRSIAALTSVQRFAARGAGKTSLCEAFTASACPPPPPRHEIVGSWAMSSRGTTWSRICSRRSGGGAHMGGGVSFC